MYRGLRMDVIKGDHILILVNQAGWNLSTDDLAEKAIFHCFPLPKKNLECSLAT